MLLGASSCNGAGDCVPGSETECFPARCLGSSCVSGCTTHQDCDPDGFCAVEGRCRLDLGDGAACLDAAYPGLPAADACQGGYCFEDTWNQSGAYCASAVDACVAAGAVVPPGIRLCQGNTWYKVCLGGVDGWGNQVVCASAALCDAGGGPGRGVRAAEV